MCLCPAHPTWFETTCAVASINVQIKGVHGRGEVIYSGAMEERDAAVGRNDLFWTLHARTIVMGKALLSATRRLHINGTGRLQL